MSKRDSDPISVCTRRPDDFTHMMVEIMSEVQYKLFFLIFIIFIILNSDVFINRILSKFDGAVEGHHTKSWGTILQGTFLVLGAIGLDAMIKNNVV